MGRGLLGAILGAILGVLGSLSARATRGQGLPVCLLTCVSTSKKRTNHSVACIHPPFRIQAWERERHRPQVRGAHVPKLHRHYHHGRVVPSRNATRRDSPPSRQLCKAGIQANEKSIYESSDKYKTDYPHHSQHRRPRPPKKCGDDTPRTKAKKARILRQST